MIRAYIFGALLASFMSFISVFGNEPSNVYLLRAPRSGTHWFFYFSRVLFGINIRADARCEGDRIITAHNPYDLHMKEDSYDKDFLILLVRNFRECLLRDYEDPENVKNEILYQASFNSSSYRKNWVLNFRKNHYFHNLRVYDMWNPEKRLIVYYEDLLQTPQEVLLKIAEFIGEANKKDEIQAFIDNLDEHMNESLKIYEGLNNRGYKSHTRGRSFLHHTNKIGIDKARKIDKLVLKCFPYLVDKYLSRYLLDPTE